MQDYSSHCEVVYSSTEKCNITFLVFIIPFLMGLGVDLYVPSLPAITDYFHTQSGLVQLTISIYMLGWGLGQIFLGILSDSFGRKKILLYSTCVFTLISFISTLAPTIIIFNICRFFQGMGIAGMAAVARAVLVDVFQGKELAKATNYFTLSWSLGPIIAPFMGGYLQHYFDWQSNFYLFGLYGLFVYLFAFYNLPETNKHLRELSVGKACANIKKVVTHKVFMYLTTVSALSYAMIVLFNAVGPFLIQSILKYSVIENGNISLVLGLAYFFGALSNRFLISYFNSMSLLLFGLLGAITANIIMIILASTMDITLSIIMVPIFIMFFLIGFIVPNALARTMSLFSSVAGTASSVFGTLNGIIVSIVAAFASILKVESQIPMANTCLVLLLISLLLFYISSRGESDSKIKYEKE